MTLNKSRTIATIVVSSLLAAVAVADDREVAADAITATAATTTELNRSLAESANTTAVEEAVAAVLAENRLDLDIRLIGRTSQKIVDGR